MKRYNRTLLSLGRLGMSVALAVYVAAGTAGADGKHGIDTAYIDKSVKPCVDFYQYANGAWLATSVIPADRSAAGAANDLLERNQAVLHDILEQAAADKDAPVGSAKRKVGDFYRIGMDTARVEAEGAKPLTPEFDRIAAIQDVYGLQDTIAHLHRIGVGAAFGFNVGQDAKNSTQNVAQLRQGGLGLPERDYYLRDDPKSQATRKQYVAHIARMLALLGDAPDKANAEADTVLALETRLAKASLSRVELRDPYANYHKMNLAALNALAPGVFWDRYFTGIGLTDPGEMIVGQPNFFAELGRMLTDVPLDQWKTYLRWHLINTEADKLNSAFVDEDFAFKGKVLAGTKELRPRWKRVLTVADTRLGELLGQLYVAKAFPPRAKARALALVNNLKAALRDRLKSLEWMSPETQAQALKKLDAIAVKIGYPDKWRDYSGLPVDKNSFVLNTIQADDFDFQRRLNKIGKPVDRTEWVMTPPTVNAYYNPVMNEIVFPAGILQPPFFDAKADDAVNYGAIGMIIGHEMTHGFDDQGRKFDAEGNLKNWWTADDEKNFNGRAEQLAKQYDTYVAVDNLHVNGKLTLGENIADLGGLKIAYLALQKALEGKPRPKIDGFTPEQRFFLAYAQAWRSNIREESRRLAVTVDPHSPPRFRVLGPLANMPEFFQAFHCEQEGGQPGTMVTIW